MLRITIHDMAEAMTFKLEGKLSGEWVHVLQECWQSAGTCQREKACQVDLTDVTYVDDAGRRCLASLRDQGVEFIAADCLMKAIVDEINQNDGSSFLN